MSAALGAWGARRPVARDYHAKPRSPPLVGSFGGSAGAMSDDLDAKIAASQRERAGIAGCTNAEAKKRLHSEAVVQLGPDVRVADLAVLVHLVFECWVGGHQAVLVSNVDVVVDFPVRLANLARRVE